MPRPFDPPDGDDLVQLYLTGTSPNQLGDRWGVGRTGITGYLRRRGVPIRGTTEANQLLAASRTPAQRKLYAQAAHDAVRGVRQTPEHRAKIARTIEARFVPNAAERLLGEWLVERGLPVTWGKAVGGYNLDIAAEPIAVEVWGGHWHLHGHHAARHATRRDYLLDEGWHLVVVAVTLDYPLGPEAADQVVALHDLARRDPAAFGQQRVVGGDGQDLTGSCFDLD